MLLWKQMLQHYTRDMLNQMMKDIKEPHCIICGDTTKDGKLIKIKTDKGVKYLCEFCHRVQNDM